MSKKPPQRKTLTLDREALRRLSSAQLEDADAAACNLWSYPCNTACRYKSCGCPSGGCY
jgi:hypothetical protein